MNDATPGKPAGEPSPAVSTAAAAAPRPTASAPPARNTLAMVVPVICLVAVSVMWLRLDGQIAQLRDGQPAARHAHATAVPVAGRRACDLAALDDGLQPAGDYVALDSDVAMLGRDALQIIKQSRQAGEPSAV